MATTVWQNKLSFPLLFLLSEKERECVSERETERETLCCLSVVVTSWSYTPWMRENLEKKKGEGSLRVCVCVCEEREGGQWVSEITHTFQSQPQGVPPSPPTWLECLTNISDGQPSSLWLADPSSLTEMPRMPPVSIISPISAAAFRRLEISSLVWPVPRMTKIIS